MMMAKSIEKTVEELRRGYVECFEGRVYNLGKLIDLGGWKRENWRMPYRFWAPEQLEG